VAGVGGELTRRRIRTPPWSRLAVPGFGLVCAAVSVGIVASSGRLVTTYAAASPWLAAAALTPGLCLIAIGCAAEVSRSTGWSGNLATLLGIAWLAPTWLGWQGDVTARHGVEFARSLGIVAVPFLVPLLAHLTLAYPGGRATSTVVRLLVGAGYASAAVAGAGRATFYDPFFDRYCWSNCTTNWFLVHNSPGLARAFGSFGLWASAVLGVTIVGMVAWRLVRTTPIGRGGLWFVLVPAAATALGEAAYAVALLSDPAENPQRQPYPTLYLTRAAALTLLALGLAWAFLRAQRRRSAVARLADELGATPPLGSLRSALAQALGDDRLQVGYWLSDAGRYVDASGRPFEPRPDRDRAVTSIRRGGEPVAVVVHDRALDDGRRLEREIGSAARLAIDNERLRAALLAQLEGLRASRARIVESGDQARRRLERDLHDGAQQRLLAVTYELRLARAEADSAGDGPLTAEMNAAVDDAQVALAELREIAHGIFPTILDEAGLAPALWTLADRARIPIEIGDVPDERLAGGVERAAYLVVTEAARAAMRDDRAELFVQIDRRPETLVVMVEGVPEDPYDHIADRVGALGGRLSIEPNRLRAEIPCD
jgi:signal transduction histidine kinase